MNDIVQRTKEAMKIFELHLSHGALEPVNVDGIARNTVKDRLKIADKELFTVPQKQIFNLMKFDSYQRFIKSDLYMNCLEAEAEGRPLPITNTDPNLQTASTISKLKKSLSNAEDRRKSLLPWNRKVRCKSKDREENKDCPSICGSRSSLSSFDATISKISSFDPDDSKCSLCRVLLDNGATTIVQVRRKNEKIGELLERLLEKRGIFYQSYEAYIVGSKQPLDLDNFSTILAGKEIMIEQRIQFKLDLHDRQKNKNIVLSVKSKPNKILSEVLRPILHKYNYRLEQMKVLKGTKLVDTGEIKKNSFF